MAERFRRRFCELFAFLDGFLGREGLLERLESWIFVDWSEANQHVQEVNFPVNLLYAASLEAAGRLYDRKDWIDCAAVMRRRVQELAWDGRCFGDNAVRTASGILERTDHHTEACQYYAFYFDVAHPDTHAALWHKLRDEFGPLRDAAKLYPETHPANALVDNLELLEKKAGKKVTDLSRLFVYYNERVREGTVYYEKIHLPVRFGK